MSRLRIGLLFGGKSGEHEVSITSAMSVYNALDKNKYDVTLVGIDKNGRWVYPDQSEILLQAKNPRLIALNKSNEPMTLVPYKTEKSLVALSSRSTISAQNFDVILPILHGTNGEDGTIQGLLELADIPYVGSGVLGSSVGMDKDVSRRLLQQAGIPVVPTVVLRKHEYHKNKQARVEQVIDQLGLPFFVKPANAGSSVGVNKVKTREEAISKIDEAFLYDNKVLAEKSIAARELEISVLGNEEPRTSVIGEIIPTHEFYSYEAKYIDENGAQLKIPAENLSPALQRQLPEMAAQAFQVLELRGLARVDFFLDKNTNELYLNEVNTLPGFTSISMYPKMWEATGLKYSALLDELIRLALENHRQKNQLLQSYQTSSEKK